MKSFALALLLFFLAGPSSFDAYAQCPYSCVPPVTLPYGQMPPGNRSGGIAPNGFAALRDLDLDNNMVFDRRDPAFAEVQLWLDENGDGVSQPNELHSLSSLGIVSLDLDYRTSHRQVDGAVLRLRAPVHFSSGQSRNVFDVYFGRPAQEASPFASHARVSVHPSAEEEELDGFLARRQQTVLMLRSGVGARWAQD
jgi:hypothetical protein